MKGSIKNYALLVLSAMIIIGIAVFTMQKRDWRAKGFVPEDNGYGVYLSIDSSEIEKLRPYHTVVIDCQYFDKEDIDRLHKDGQIVYSYLNVGAIENFRDYYQEYEELFLGDYENWPEEKWVNVADESWYRFIGEELAGELLDKGVDGFFIDNCDVYYHYPEEDIYNGLVSILKKLVSYEKAVIINGGDYFADAYYENNGSVHEVFTGINQEGVFSTIDFDRNQLVETTQEEHEYFTNYIEKYGALGMDIYLLEYTKDEKVIEEIRKYCAREGFSFFVSDSKELE